jgi:hypothetical protein
MKTLFCLLLASLFGFILLITEPVRQIPIPVYEVRTVYYYNPPSPAFPFS